MSPELIAVVEPFVRRGLFPNAEMAVAEIALVEGRLVDSISCRPTAQVLQSVPDTYRQSGSDSVLEANL